MIKALSETKPKPKIWINKKKLEEIRKDFYKLRHLSESETEEIRKKFNELEKSSMFKKSHGNIDSIDYDDLDNHDYNYDFAHDDEYRKIGSTRTLFKEFDRDCYKPIRTDGGFAARNNNYIGYTSEGDR